MLKLYNTLTKTKDTFVPLHTGKVGMYTCGPTVYNHIHIGNLRAYSHADVVRRYLTYCGYEVRMIKNITDVGHLTDDDVAQGDSGEDKMEKAAAAAKKTPQEIARFYEDYAFATQDAMNILRAQYNPRATEHIPQMIRLIETLIAKGHAYAKNGNVFFDVTSFDRYGALSGNTVEKLNVGARLEDPHPDKRNQWDFALWLKAPANHVMKWTSPWSVGYPGWHIECSAMSLEYLGPTFDIHTGGEDNIFPHHEAEIAQSECANDAPFVRLWLHTRHLRVDGEKMSKSKGNFYVLEDVVQRGFDPMDLRMLFLLSHYRSQMNFTWDAIAQARKNRLTLLAARARLTADAPTSDVPATMLDVAAARAQFEDAMNDDLNTPAAVTALLALARAGNVACDAGHVANATDAAAFLTTALTTLGIRIPEESSHSIPRDILALARERDAARNAKDFAAADALRDEIAAKGYVVTDAPSGTRVTKKETPHR